METKIEKKMISRKSIEQFSKECELCDRIFTAYSEKQLLFNYDLHIKHKHRKAFKK